MSFTRTNPEKIPSALLTIEEAAGQLNVSERMIRRLTSERRLDYVKVGKHVRIPATAIDRLVEDGSVQALRGLGR